MLYYIYNDVDNLLGFKYNNDLYYYQKNAQEDIIGILDSSYNVVAKYEFDSWGSITSIIDALGNDISGNLSHIGNINPFRYRSYYYDVETRLYYLNSRYYNAFWGRFVNADITTGEIGNIASCNMFQYGFNNPINMLDGDGNWPKWMKSKIFKKIVIGLAAIAVGAAVVALTGGTAAPALLAGLKAALISGAISATIASTISVATSVSKGESLNTTVNNATSNGVNAFADGFEAGGVMAGASQVVSGVF